MLKYQGSLSSFDLFLELEAFSEGRSTHAWRCFGAHPAEDEAGREGYLFRVWAPNAPKVTIIGDFNGWDLEATPMTKLDSASPVASSQISKNRSLLSMISVFS